jgi:hypothetical protein
MRPQSSLSSYDAAYNSELVLSLDHLVVDSMDTFHRYEYTFSAQTKPAWELTADLDICKSH